MAASLVVFENDLDVFDPCDERNARTEERATVRPNILVE